MTEEQKMVGRDEAADQVRVVATRLALMHLAFARTLVNELGESHGKSLVVKAMMEYGRLAGLRNRAGGQDLPHYGLHDGYSYKGREYTDSREIPPEPDGKLDYTAFKVHGCVLGQIFREYGEQELGRLYCYVDAAKTMAADPGHKLIHTACTVCGDNHCAFDLQPATDEEMAAFENKDDTWQTVDPYLLKDSAPVKDTAPED